MNSDFQQIIEDAEAFKRSAKAKSEEEYRKTSSGIYELIKEQIIDFQKELNQDYDLGISLHVSEGWKEIVVTDVIALFPSLIVFKGIIGDSESVRLIQHINQVNLVLRKVKRQDPNLPKRVIGFQVE